MNTRSISSRILLSLVLLTLFASLAAAQQSVETLGPLKATVPDAVRAAVADSGYRVSSGEVVVAEIWPAKSAVSEKNGSASALYPDFANGAFYGVISLPNGGGDFRGQKIPAGTYTMRYQLLPGDGNHMGVAPNPDFFLLLPADADTAPANKVPYQALVKLSAKASGTAHPAAFSLSSAAEKSPAAGVDDQGFVFATFPITTTGGSVKVGMILKGSAEQ